MQELEEIEFTEQPIATEQYYGQVQPQTTEDTIESIETQSNSIDRPLIYRTKIEIERINHRKTPKVNTVSAITSHHRIPRTTSNRTLIYRIETQSN